MQNTKTYVDSLFSGFEETKNLVDFKEELTGHLNDKIASLIKGGMSEDGAFEKAAAELGDISAVAEELSLRKKQEVYSEMYMGTRKYLTPKRTALFVLGGTLICFGMIFAAITWFATEMRHASVASGILFIALGAGFLTFMGLTQETAAKNPMSYKKALLYAVSVAAFLFGILAAPLVYFATTSVDLAELAANGWMLSSENLGFTSGITVLFMFVLPSAALFAFLFLTEKDRSKPWVKKIKEKEAALFADPATQTRFGIFSGVIWITAIALFVFITILSGILFSWLAIAAALVGQMLLTARFLKKHD